MLLGALKERNSFDFGRAAQICRYYLKHQNYPQWENQSEYEKGVQVACQNLEKLFLEEGEKMATTRIESAIAAAEKAREL